MRGPVSLLRLIRSVSEAGNLTSIRSRSACNAALVPAAVGAGSYRGLHDNYRFVVPAANRTHEMSNLEVKMEASGTKCCDCGTNVRRRFVLNGRQIIADGSENQERGIILR